MVVYRKENFITYRYYLKFLNNNLIKVCYKGWIPFDTKLLTISFVVREITFTNNVYPYFKMPSQLQVYSHEDDISIVKPFYNLYNCRYYTFNVI